MDMFEPIREGNRGGQGNFKWSDVSADKDREHYLGHSINAPTGRWQKNKDVHWYNRDKNDSEADRRAEMKKIKEAEADALAMALGYAPNPKTADDAEGDEKDEKAVEPRIAMEKAEKKRRKEEKRARKEMKRLAKAERHHRDYADDRDHRSDRRRNGASRSRSPDRRRTPPRNIDYGEAERERERERDRRRWNDNARRDMPRRW